MAKSTTTFNIDRQAVLRENFQRCITQLPMPQVNTPLVESSKMFQVVFRSMLASRLLDYQARTLAARGQGFYTISGAGHEISAVVAAT
ncbi:MAG: hypothetical protein GKR77_07200, partial [Legionellales bacterium]|nr:hypothetical protein [Legionellales bacterium]